MSKAGGRPKMPKANPMLGNQAKQLREAELRIPKNQKLVAKREQEQRELRKLMAKKRKA